MSETLPPRRRVRERAPTNSDPIDIAMEAVARDADGAAVAVGLLKDQRRLIGWEIAEKRAGLTLQLLTIAAGLVVAFALGVMAWQASRAGGLVVDPFSVPPDLAARGVTGPVVAAQLLDKLTALQDSTAAAKPARRFENAGADIKVEIPQTGVSLGELSRYLRQWLGHETHITGEVFRTTEGLTVKARAAGQAGDATSGTEADLDKLLQGVAETIYGRTESYRYAFYLKDQGRTDEAIARFMTLAEGPMNDDRAWADTVVSQILFSRGDVAGAQAKAEELIRLMPDNPYAVARYKSIQYVSGRDEGWRWAAKRGLDLMRRYPQSVTERSRLMQTKVFEADLGETSGDFVMGARRETEAAQLPDFEGNAPESATWAGLDLALAHDAAASDAAFAMARAKATGEPSGLAYLILQQGLPAMIVLGRWREAVEAGRGLQALVGLPFDYRTERLPGSNQQTFRRASAAQLGYALAVNGALAEGEAMAAATPLDCYRCVRIRGQIAALKGDRKGAEHWFGEAARIGPSLPFAHAEWGQMLVEAGDPAAAIPKLREANRRGPRFADPLVYWGEALMAQGDFKGAVAKFAEANNYAPRWDRLHLKWGEALSKLGKAEEARAQAALAASLKAASR